MLQKKGVTKMSHATDESRRKIEKMFVYQPPTNEQLPLYSEIQAEAIRMGFAIDSCCPESREKAIALTHLETAIMWAKKAVAFNVKETK
mgnify:CR=1 FL=1